MYLEAERGNDWVTKVNPKSVKRKHNTRAAVMAEPESKDSSSSWNIPSSQQGLPVTLKCSESQESHKKKN